MIHQNQIEKYKQLPKREKIGADKKREYWYEDIFQKSANEYYGLGKIYFINCGNKYVGKTVDQLIYKLKSNSNYIYNKSFKDAVNGFIKSDLLTKPSTDEVSSWNLTNQYFYVDDENIVRNITTLDYLSVRDYLHSTEYFITHYPQYKDITYSLWNLHLYKKESRVFEFYHSTFKYIVRVKGLHYYVTNEELKYIDIYSKYLPRLTATHQVVINNARCALNLLKLSINDLKYHGLMDVRENIEKLIQDK